MIRHYMIIKFMWKGGQIHFLHCKPHKVLLNSQHTLTCWDVLRLSSFKKGNFQQTLQHNWLDVFKRKVLQGLPLKKKKDYSIINQNDE